jgi:hypothetical protein
MSDDRTQRPCSLNDYIKRHPEMTAHKAQKAWEKWCNEYRKYQLEQS